MFPWPRKAFLTLCMLVALAVLPHHVERLGQWRLVQLDSLHAIADFIPHPSTLALPGDDPVPPDAPGDRTGLELIQDESNSLDPFYADLLRTERNQPGAVTRILHYGDSPTTADLITADLRDLLQERFGNAGHGLHLLAKPWAWYGHRGVDVRAWGWRVAPVTQRGEADGWYGVAGVCFSGGDGAWSRFALRGAGHSRMVVHYGGGVWGGEFSVLAGGNEIARIDTVMEEAGAARRSVALPPGTREVELRVEKGPVRLFAVSFEAPGPGVIYDSLGLNGASAVILAHFQNQAHWASQLRAVHPSLVVLNYGTNESGFEKYVKSTYRDDLRKTIQRIRGALPGTPLLVMSPMDRGFRAETDEIATVPALPRLVEIQREVAHEEGVAFYNTFQAMGGEGTMGKWYTIEPRLVSADFIHPLPAGGRVVANLLERALMRGFNLYKLRLLRGETTTAEAGSK